MTPDFRALARDVDDFFRARRDGYSTPHFEKRAIEGMDGSSRWVPCAAEERALSLVDRLEGRCRDSKFDPTSWLCTRRHVATLALIEPEYFRECVDRARASGSIRKEIVLDDGQRLVRKTYYNRALRYRRVTSTRVPASKIDADITRTAKFLADLEERLRPLLAAKVLEKDPTVAETSEAARRAERDARTEAAIAEDEESFNGWVS